MNRPFLFSFISFIGVLFISIPSVFAQQNIFATLQGEPVMNTTGWNIVGGAKVSKTVDATNDEMIVCPMTSGTGGCFFHTPININSCNVWIAEFDYRMYDGNGADGLAFCFLANPPTGFVSGGGIGIPVAPKGLMVVLDSYHNCGVASVPKLEIRYGDGVNNYSECPNPAQPEVDGLAILRQSAYNHMKIMYNNGNINVYINGVFYLSGYYLTNYTGYLGFTASCGALNDNHSVKNVVIYNNMPFADAGKNTVICSGDSIMIGSQSHQNYNYIWSPTIGMSNPNISNPVISLTNNTKSFVSYTYKVTVDTAGLPCQGVDSVVISVDPGPVLNTVKDTLVCTRNDSFHFSAPAGYAGYLWSTSDTTNYINIKKSGKYWLKVNDINGCKTIDTANVTLKPTPVVIGLPDSVCKGNSATISATGSGSEGPYKYYWDTGETNQIITVAPDSTKYYSVTVTDLSDCHANTPVLVKVFPLPSVSLGNARTVCTGIAVTLTANTSGGAYPYKYKWNTNDTNNIITVNSPHTTVYSVTVIDARKCTDTSEVNVVINPKPVINIIPSNPKICKGDSVTINVNGASNYNWTPATGLSEDTGNIIKASPSYTLVYTINATDSLNCTADTAFQLIVSNPVTTISKTKDKLCFGDTLMIKALTENGIKPYIYKWLPGNYSTSELDLKNNYDTVTVQNYTVLIEDSISCRDSSSFLITFLQPVKIKAIFDSVCLSSCDGYINLVTFDSDGNPDNNGSLCTYNWNNNDYTKNIAGLCTGNYIVTVTDRNNCAKDEAIGIPVILVDTGHSVLPVSGFTPLSVTFQYTGVNNNITWNLGDNSSGNNIITGKSATHTYNYSPYNAKNGVSTYIAKLIVNNLKCTDTIKIYIEVKATGQIDTVSNVITDRTMFGLRGKGLKSFDILIFNRWGAKVIDKSNYIPEFTYDGEEQIAYLWDGKKDNGSYVDAGAYFYIVKAITIDDKILPQRAGTVTVLR